MIHIKENIKFKTIKVFNEKELKALDDLVLINNWIWMTFSSKTIKISGNVYQLKRDWLSNWSAKLKN